MRKQQNGVASSTTWRGLAAALGGFALFLGSLLGLRRLFRKRPGPPETPAAEPAPAGLPRHDHERSDVRIGPIVGFGAGMVIVAVVIHVALWGLFNAFLDRDTASEPLPPPLARTPQFPPEPRLQVNYEADMRRLRESEDAVLNGYGWVNQDAGVVRIPIDRAMELLAERGLPARDER